MILKSFFLVLVCFLCSFAFGSSSKSIVENSFPDYDTTKSNLVLFQNIEMIEYCVLLPLKEFQESAGNEFAIKAKHNFIPVNKPGNDEYIEVQGFIIDKNNSNNVKLFYDKDVKEIEENGLAIDTSYVDTVRNYYVIIGYLPNFMEKKFISVSWVFDDKITLNIGLDKNSNYRIWNSRIEEIIDRGVICH